MESVSAQPSDDIHSTAQSLKPKKKVLLEAIATAPAGYGVSMPGDGCDYPIVKTNYLTRKTELSNDVVAYHMKSLIRRGLVERPADELVPVDTSPGPQEENAYRCTERGYEVATFDPEFPVGESVEDIRDELERQRQEIATLREQNQMIKSQHNKYVKKLEESGILD